MAGNTAKSTSAKEAAGPLPLVSVNHISLVCRSVEDSMDFYENVLGFFPIKRPGSFNFDGAWLFSYGMGIHLLQSPNPEGMPKKQEINPMDNHMSFQVCLQNINPMDTHMSFQACLQNDGFTP